jgi:hypothetical protein
VFNVVDNVVIGKPPEVRNPTVEQLARLTVRVHDMMDPTHPLIKGNKIDGAKDQLVGDEKQGYAWAWRKQGIEEDEAFWFMFMPLPKIAGLLKIGARVEELGQGFNSFRAFKRAMGPAGQGQAWHHIVEQTSTNVQRFGAETIHNTENLIRLPHGAGSIHARISGYYSSIRPFTGGRTVRQWLSTQSYKAQYDFGINTLRNFGWNP